MIEIRLVPLSPTAPPPEGFDVLVHAIWPSRGAEIYALFANGADDIEPTTDHPFLIKVADQAIGLTGFYRYATRSVGLSWHGIVPPMRGYGISRAVFGRICELAKQRYPEAIDIVELIPSDRGAELVPYFERLGFQHQGEIASFDYLPKGPIWRVYRAPLSIHGEAVRGHDA
jgi:hypothetical protein